MQKPAVPSPKSCSRLMLLVPLKKSKNILMDSHYSMVYLTNSIYGSAELSTPNSFKKWPIMGQAKQYGGNQSTNIKI